MNSTMTERHFAPMELAELWAQSVDTIRRIFENEPGVIIHENTERTTKRRFRTIRIPESVAQRVYTRMAIK
jgi:hypothetical protein